MAATWSNASGKPLSSGEWLEAHHRAKLPERRAFAARLAQLQPQTVVDLGCGTGLWLEVLNDAFPTSCDFVGIDSDRLALDVARDRSKRWLRETTFIEVDFERESDRIPKADLTLAFNILPYVRNVTEFLGELGATRGGGTVVIRQYDGGTMRYGPMPTSSRVEIEASLFAAVSQSAMFRHYDADRVFAAIEASPFSNRQLFWETFQRFSPFPEEFLPYYRGTLQWTADLLSESSRELFNSWIAESQASPTYFVGVDLVALLS